MDSSRRHELEQNSLYRALSRLPTFVGDYGAYVLLGVAIVVAVYFYFSTRTTAAQREREAEAIGVFSMSATIENARGYQQTVARFGSRIPYADVTRELADLSSEFEGYAMLPDTSERPGIRSRALRLRGDFNWTMASFQSVLPDSADLASTQPATAPATQELFAEEAYLSAAEVAYREVLAKHSDQVSDALVALFGLAAIAEERGEFDAAAQSYDALLAREDVTEGVKALARQRKDLLEVLALKPRLAEPMPTTLPSSQPSSQPATLPSTSPTRPSTLPQSEPASVPPKAPPEPGDGQS